MCTILLVVLIIDAMEFYQLIKSWFAQSVRAVEYADCIPAEV